jgi:hypothetical protein
MDIPRDVNGRFVWFTLILLDYFLSFGVL